MTRKDEHVGNCLGQRPRKIGLLSVGAYRPERVVTNEEICRNIDSSDEWIFSRTGIKTRRFAADDETAASMAVEASREALTRAALDPTEIDGVILATNTHFLQTPAAAPPSRRRSAPREYRVSTSRWGARASATRWPSVPTWCAAAARARCW